MILIFLWEWGTGGWNKKQLRLKDKKKYKWKLRITMTENASPKKIRKYIKHIVVTNQAAKNNTHCTDRVEIRSDEL